MVANNELKPMSLDEARKVIWPFRDIKGHEMGYLLDRALIDKQDLVYASEKSTLPHVRQSARILLKQLEPPPSPTKVVDDKSPLNIIRSGLRSFAERQQYEILAYASAACGFGLGIAIAVLVANTLGVINRAETISTRANDNPLAFFIFIVLIIGMTIASFAIGGWIGSKISKKFDRRMKLLRKGQQGEETALNVFTHALNGNWTLFKNLELRGQNGDIDFVLVGSGGVWVIEVKTYSGQYRNIGDQWQYFSFNRWINVRKNPSHQAKSDAGRINHILKLHEIKQWVNPAILWANIGNAPLVDNPTVPVWTLDSFLQELKKVAAKPELSPEKVEQIVNTLMKAANFNKEYSAEEGLHQLPA